MQYMHVSTTNSCSLEFMKYIFGENSGGQDSPLSQPPVCCTWNVGQPFPCRFLHQIPPLPPQRHCRIQLETLALVARTVPLTFLEHGVGWEICPPWDDHHRNGPKGTDRLLHATSDTNGTIQHNDVEVKLNRTLTILYWVSSVIRRPLGKCSA